MYALLLMATSHDVTNTAIESPESTQITLSYNTHPIDEKVHFHSKYKIIFVTNGSAKIQIANKTFIIKKNDMLFLNSCEFFSISTNSTPFHRYLLILSPDIFSNQFADDNILGLFRDYSQNDNHCIHIKNFNDIKALFDKMIFENTGNDDIYSERLINHYLSELFIYSMRCSQINVSRLHNEMNQKILAAQNLLEDNYHTNIKISDVCNRLHMSPYYFTHQFTKISGCSPKQYLTKTRLNHAGILLSQTNLTINEISERVGFSDMNNFIKCFKKTFNSSPASFRKKQQSIVSSESNLP